MSTIEIQANYDSSSPESRAAVLNGFAVLIVHLMDHERDSQIFEDKTTRPESVHKAAKTVRFIRGFGDEDAGPLDPESLVQSELDDFAAISGRRQQRRDTVMALHDRFRVEGQPEDEVVKEAAVMFQNLLIGQAVEGTEYCKIAEADFMTGVLNAEASNLAWYRFFAYLGAYSALTAAEAHAPFWYPFDDL